MPIVGTTGSKTNQMEQLNKWIKRHWFVFEKASPNKDCHWCVWLTHKSFTG